MYVSPRYATSAGPVNVTLQVPVNQESTGIVGIITGVSSERLTAFSDADLRYLAAAIATREKITDTISTPLEPLLQVDGVVVSVATTLIQALSAISDLVLQLAAGFLFFAFLFTVRSYQTSGV